METTDTLVALLNDAFSDPDVVNHPRWLNLWRAVLCLLRMIDQDAADRVAAEP